MQVELLQKLHKDKELVTFVNQMTALFMKNNIDLTYVFLKTVLKKISHITDPTAHQQLCEFVLGSVVTVILE